MIDDPPILPILLLLAAFANPAECKAASNNAVLLEQLEGADSNKDGNVSKAELKNFRAANFGRLDRNGDGVLMRSDIPAMAKRFRPEVDFDRLLKQFDANKDNKVSRSEFVDGPTTIFDMADSNKDGLLSKAERTAAVKAAKG
jgi:Ca2+-binding EF-hand superfamily protein